MFEDEGHGESEEDAERHGGTKGEQEDANSVEKRCEVYLGSVELRERPMEYQSQSNLREVETYSLVHDDTNGIVQQTFTEDDGIQFWVDLVLVEYRKDGHRVRSG